MIGAALLLGCFKLFCNGNFLILSPPPSPKLSSQARLTEIITSGAKTVHNNGSPAEPWMADGAGLPSNACELLPILVSPDIYCFSSSFSDLYHYS